MINWFIIRKEYYNKIKNTNKPQLLTFNTEESIYRQSEINIKYGISALVADVEPIIQVKVINKLYNDDTKQYELWLKNIN